ncbi:diiron oxygenase [Gordonia malaquae]|uniref:AurF N-oxygenase family protein n=1 Tax=Gordonia malaquae TaxID=410332 RepID=UPI0030FE6A6A
MTILENTSMSTPDRGVDEVSQRLVESAARLSRNAMTEIDWSEPMDPAHYGCSPEWSTLYGTDYWNELTVEQQVTLTRHEFASIMNVGIWFEMILQELVLRDQYLGRYHEPEFQFALTEIADECRHSIMFAKASSKMVGTSYHPPRRIGRLGKIFQHTARGAVSYAGILVAEEILDVFQRGCMRDERVLPFIRTINEIHVLEESRHMKFAREQVRESMAGMSPLKRRFCALYTSLGALYIVSNLVQPQVYANAGLDVDRALAERRTNKHFHAMVRSNCTHLMEFLDDVGVLTRAARRNYRRVHMI